MNLFKILVYYTPNKEVFMAIRGSGELKIEFYSHLNEIKDLYFNQGFVVFKILHQKVVDTYNLTLDYQAFCYYARKELKGKKKLNSSSKKIEQEKKDNFELEGNKEEKSTEPIISYPSFSKAKAFNPHSSNVDEDRIIK
ncbi:MAG: Unknown protein [uncultured Sulfurovum sp.]|uniref:Uncharacterized protein n=1 Tax=uncultured Sulfurovum sp. TaxID=269237 RepID=A0A6S6U062_9BACT|nr:MAG: Unknown protein [uncultured Sulfurovum sp.]